MAERVDPPVEPAGGSKPWMKTILEAGAETAPATEAVREFDAYLVGFQCARMDSRMQVETHYYYTQVNDDLAQAIIYDGNTRDANLIGLEYVISGRLFESLPTEERQYWHPHNHEILSGTLVAPDLPEPAEKTFMRELMNSYGKAWNTWHTGRRDAPGHNVPVGEPRLMWSFNRDGEMLPELMADRDRALRVDNRAKREGRADLAENAYPQHGVDAMDDAFPDRRDALDGVVDAKHATRETKRT